MENLNYTLEEFRKNKPFAALFVVYISLNCYLLSALITRFVLAARKNTVESLYDYPEDCSDFAKGTCVRTDLFRDHCRGTRYDQPIVYQAPRKEMGAIIANCVETSTSGYDIGILSMNPVLENCNYNSVRNYDPKMFDMNYGRFMQPQCIEYAHVMLGDSWSNHIYDLYIKQNQLDNDHDHSYVQVQVQHRLAWASNFSYSITQKLYQCIAEQAEPGTASNFLPCTRS